MSKSVNAQRRAAHKVFFIAIKHGYARMNCRCRCRSELLRLPILLQLQCLHPDAAPAAAAVDAKVSTSWWCRCRWHVDCQRTRRRSGCTSERRRQRPINMQNSQYLKRPKVSSSSQWLSPSLTIVLVCLRCSGSSSKLPLFDYLQRAYGRRFSSAKSKGPLAP